MAKATPAITKIKPFRKEKKAKSKFEELLKSSLAPTLPKLGEIIEGKVAAIEGSRLYIDLGGLKTGIVYGVEFFNARHIIKNLKVGAKISGKVIELENEDGYIELSLTGSIEELSWEKLKEMKENRDILMVKIEEANKGGLLTTIENQKAFMPVSQLTAQHYPRVEEGDKEKILEELRKFVGQEFKVRIIDVDPRENKLIISEREAQDEKIKQAISKFKVGDIVEGTISGVVDFGAFIKFKANGIDLEGLIHISELDWQLIENPKDVVQVGQKVKAKIISIDDDRVSLSLKTLKKNPWAEIEKKYKVGQEVKGVLMKFNPFGAFIKIDKDIHGLVHISEFGSEEKMKEKIKPNKKYKFKILSIEPEHYRMALRFLG